MCAMGNGNWRQLVAKNTLFPCRLGLASRCSLVPARGIMDNNMVDNLFGEFDRPGVPGAAVMVIERGQVRLAKGFGLANLETKVPCAPETNFRLASLTKPFTAMSILILAGRGNLTLDDPMPRFFARFPHWGGAITIRHLLSHTSGLPDYEDWIPAATTAPLKDSGVLEILRGRDRPYFPPGTGFRYSNSGYACLALIVERMSGVPFAAFLRENIFQPLAMNRTVAYESGVSEVPNRAIGYSKRGARFEQTDQSLTSAVLGDGGIYSSVADLFKWDQALYSDKLISRALWRQAVTAVSKTSDCPGSGYGFGWYVDRRRVWHHGETCGFTTRLERFPTERLTTIILANRSNARLSSIARQLAARA